MGLYSRRIFVNFLPKVVVVIASLLLTAPALAAAANRRAQERDARKACLSGDYAKGVAILSELFVDFSDPTYIFNQGRCFEQNLQYREAIGRFQEYLRAGETLTLRQVDRDAAQKHIADCKARLAEDSAKAANQPAPPPPAAKSQPAVPEGPAPVVEHGPPEAKGHPGLLTAGIIVAAVGVASVGAGVAFALKANSMVSDWDGGSVNGYSRSQQPTYNAYRDLMWAGYGVGAACIATGVILGAVGIASHRAASTGVALVPALGYGQAGMLLAGGFR